MKKVNIRRIKSQLLVSKILKITIGTSFALGIIGGSAFGIYSLYKQDNRPNLLTYDPNDLNKIHNSDNYCGYSTETNDIYVCYANNVQVRSSYKGLIGPKEVNKIADFIKNDVVNGIEGISNSVIDLTPGLTFSNGGYTLGFRTDSEQRESKLDISPDFYDNYNGSIQNNALQQILKDRFYDTLNLSQNYDKKAEEFYSNNQILDIILKDKKSAFSSWNVIKTNSSDLIFSTSDILDEYQKMSKLSSEDDRMSSIFGRITGVSQIGLNNDQVISKFLKNTKTTKYMNSDSKSYFRLLNKNIRPTNYQNFFHFNMFNLFDLFLKNYREFITVSDVYKTLPISFKDVIDNTNLSAKEKISYMAETLSKYYDETINQGLDKDIPFFERMIYSLKNEIDKKEPAIKDESIKSFLDMYSSFFDNAMFTSYITYSYGLISRTPSSANYGQSSPLTTFFSNDYFTLYKYTNRIFNLSDDFDISKRISSSVVSKKFLDNINVDIISSNSDAKDGYFFSHSAFSYNDDDKVKFERLKDDVRDIIINSSLYTISHEYGHHNTLSHFNAGGVPGRDLITTFTVENGSATLYNKKLFQKLYKTINSAPGISNVGKYNFLASNDNTTSTQVLPYFSFSTSPNSAEYNNMYGIYDLDTSSSNGAYYFYDKDKNHLDFSNYSFYLNNDKVFYYFLNGLNKQSTSLFLNPKNNTYSSFFLPKINYNPSIYGEIDSKNPIKFSIRDKSYDDYLMYLNNNPGESFITEYEKSSDYNLNYKFPLGYLFTGFKTESTLVAGNKFDDWLVGINDITKALKDYSLINQSIIANDLNISSISEDPSFDQLEHYLGRYFSFLNMLDKKEDSIFGTTYQLKDDYSNKNSSLFPIDFDSYSKNIHLLEYSRKLDQISDNDDLKNSFLKIYKSIKDLITYQSDFSIFEDKETPITLDLSERDTILNNYLSSLNEFVGLVVLKTIKYYSEFNNYLVEYNALNATIDKDSYLYKSNYGKLNESTSNEFYSTIEKYSDGEYTKKYQSYEINLLLDGEYNINYDKQKVEYKIDDTILKGIKKGISDDSFYGLSYNLDTLELLNDKALDQGSGLDSKIISGIVSGRPSYKMETAELLTRALQVLTFRGHAYNFLESSAISSSVLEDYQYLSSNGLILYDNTGNITQTGKDLFDVYREMWGLKLDPKEVDENGIKKVIGADDITRFYKVYRNRKSYIGGWISKEDDLKYNAVKFFNPKTNKTVYKKIYTKNTSSIFLYNKILPGNVSSSSNLWLKEAKNTNVTGNYIQWTSEDFIDGEYANADLGSGSWEISFVNIDSKQDTHDLQTISNFDYSETIRLNYNYLQDNLSWDAYLVARPDNKKVILEVR